MARIVIYKQSKKRREVEIADEATIGRAPDVDIELRGLTVSRRHARIWKEGDSYFIEDLDSENGTWVDGTPIKKRPLRPGVTIQIADYVLEFDLGPATPAEAATERSTIWGREESTGPMDVVAKVNADHLRLGDDIKKLSTTARADALQRRLDAVYEISRAAGRIEELDDLFTEMLERLLDALPNAERAFVALQEPRTGELTVTETLLRTGATADAPPLSNTITGLAITNREGVLCADARADFNSASSVRAMGLGSVMCAPLALPDKVLGIIQVDARGRKGCFSKDDLKLLVGAASVAAVAIEKIRLYEKMRRARDKLDAENVKLRRGLPAASFHSIVGKSKPIADAVSLARRVAPVDTTVLLLGPSGTGKELFARAIHAAGPKRDGPFVVMNCAAVPETLVESELFGIERGVATGVAAREGKIEQAADGTLFLDEVGDMAPATQAKMLRVLEKNEFQRVGGKDWIKVRTRIIAATNRDLRKAMEAGHFREDLYYRLNVVSIELPPLSERPEDIPLLVDYFLKFFAAETGKEVRGISSDAMDLFRRYHWPGNVRELKNAVERGVVLVRPGEEIGPDLLPPEMSTDAPLPKPAGRLDEAAASLEKEMIRKALAEAGGNRTRAAKALGISREGLRLKMKRYGLK